MANSSLQIESIDLAKAVIAHEVLTCFCGDEKPTSTQPDVLVSCTGGCFWGRSGEAWPVDYDGQPLVPWLQIVCTEVPMLGVFHKRKMISFFIQQDFSGCEALSKEDKNEFVVREYGLDAELIPLRSPTSQNHPFHRVIWQEFQDYPSLRKYKGLFDSRVYSALSKDDKFEYQNRSGIKIGGWPTPLQRDQGYPGSCDLQIDMTENFRYADSGIGYLSRRIEGNWYVAFESC